MEHPIKENGRFVGGEERHEKFQLGTNPMKMSSFEQELVLREKMEREMAKRKYVRGVQGVDGGHFDRRAYFEPVLKGEDK